MRKALLYIFTFLGIVSTNAQCAMCKAVVENGDSGLAEGLNDGIVTLMVVPYILVAIAAFVMYRYFKSTQDQ